MTETLSTSDRPLQVAIIAMGAMGSWVSRRLTGHGVDVRSVLAGRSADSVARAKAAHVREVADDAAFVEGADFILSIVPPSAAVALAMRLAPTLTEAENKPIFVDCNAVSDQTIQEVAQIIAGTGCEMVDAGIFGVAPPDDRPGPRIYLSGPAAEKAAVLGNHGLDIRVLDAPVGSASVLKCCFAGLSKGAIALGTEAAIAAEKAGVEDALCDELTSNMTSMGTLLAQIMPQAYTKSWRWVVEMQEIGDTYRDQPGGKVIYQGASELYDAIAGASETRGTPENLIDTMDSFVNGLKAKL
jgi:putative dehydrogenase